MPMVAKRIKPISRSTIENGIHTITYWVGTPTSIGLHTLLFIVAFMFLLVGVSLDKILLIVTTIVSLEAIYLSLFIQMTVNQHTESLKSVEENIDDIQEDIDDIQEDVEDVGEDIDKIQEDEEEEEDEATKDAKIFTAIENQLAKLGNDMSLLTTEIQALKHKPNQPQETEQISS